MTPDRRIAVTFPKRLSAELGKLVAIAEDRRLSFAEIFAHLQGRFSNMSIRGTPFCDPYLPFLAG